MILALERLRALRAGRRLVEPKPLPEARHAAHVSERGYLVPDDLPGPWQERYEERAAIREYEGRQVREHAEADALRETLDAMRAAGEHPPTDI